MPSLLLLATESTPRLNGSNPAPIGKPALRLPAFSSPSTYPVHNDRPEPIPSDVNVKASVNMTQLAARRMHNALQPISRLYSDVLEQLFLTGAFLAASHAISPSSSSSSTSQYSLTRTVLTYAHLTSALRQTALRSARLWALLLDFERGSSGWNAELLRRSAGVGLQLVWQWSKATAGAGSGTRIRSLSEGSRARIDRGEWAWEGRDDVVVARRREDRAKSARLEAVLRREVLERARSLGFAVPAPYFASVLLERLATPGGALPALESLRIVKSRPRRGSITQEEEDGDEEADEDGRATYVPLRVIANAPRLRRLAIAESNLAFHELLSSSSSPSLSSQSIPPDNNIAPSSPSASAGAPLLPPPSPSALRTLHHLQALHIADLPLRTAPTAREWLRYLTLMPALEALVLEGAVLRRVDLTLRDTLKAGSGSGSDGGVHPGSISASRGSQGGRRGGMGDGEGDAKGMEDEMVEKSALPRLRLLTIDAALEDVAVFAATLPLPSWTPRGRRRQMKWTLLCADADTGGVDDVERVVNLFARAVGRDGSSGGSAAAWAEETPGLSLSVRATERDVYVHLLVSAPPVVGGEVSAARVDGADSDGWDPDPEAGFSIYVHLHSMGGGGGAGSSALPPNRTSVDGIDARPTIASTSSTVLSPVLAAMARAVLPQVSSLELELPLVASPNIHSVALNEVLRRARAVEALTLGPKAAKGVLRMLHGEQHTRSRSVDGESSFSSSSESGSDSESFSASPTTASAVTAKSSDADAVLLPSLRILHLGVESAAGPAWTALLRFVRARVAYGVPIQQIVFEDKDTEDRPQAHFARMARARIPEGRIRELEVMGVGVGMNKC
jgi:hypothetical protein